MAESGIVSFLGALVVGIVIGGILVKVLLVKPTELCPGSPEAYVTVIIEPDPKNGKGFIVSPMKAGPAEQCDLVVFVNTTGKEVTVDFAEPDASIGTPFGQTEHTIEENQEGEGVSWAPQVVVPTPEQEVEYRYTVKDSSGTEQSPVIRIGPKATISSPN